MFVSKMNTFAEALNFSFGTSSEVISVLEEQLLFAILIKSVTLCLEGPKRNAVVARMENLPASKSKGMCLKLENAEVQLRSPSKSPDSKTFPVLK